MFSEISLNSTLKDGNPQWREKTIFTRFSLMIMMLKFAENKFLWTKYEQQSSRGKAYEICNSMTSFTAHGKKTSFMTGIPER